MGESVSTESQSAKNFCSWILFPCGPQVKRKYGRVLGGRKLLVCPNLQQCAKSYSGRVMPENGSKQAEDFAPMRTYQEIYKMVPELNRGAG